MEYIATIIVQAEKKLSEGDADMLGNYLKLAVVNQPLRNSMIPEWELELKHHPLLVLKIMSHNYLYVHCKNLWVGSDGC